MEGSGLQATALRIKVKSHFCRAITAVAIEGTELSQADRRRNKKEPVGGDAEGGGWGGGD